MSIDPLKKQFDRLSAHLRSEAGYQEGEYWRCRRNRFRFKVVSIILSLFVAILILSAANAAIFGDEDGTLIAVLSFVASIFAIIASTVATADGLYGFGRRAEAASKLAEILRMHLERYQIRWICEVETEEDKSKAFESAKDIVTDMADHFSSNKKIGAPVDDTGTSPGT